MKTHKLTPIVCLIVGIVIGFMLGWMWVMRVERQNRITCSSHLESIQCLITEAVGKLERSDTNIENHVDELIQHITSKIPSSILCCPCGGEYALFVTKPNFVVVSCSYHHGWNIGVGFALDLPGAILLED